MAPAPCSPSGSRPRLRCSICKAYGFVIGKDQDNDSLPELQTDPQRPVFINHAASLQSFVDLDGYIEESGIRDAASRADAILHSQVALSCALRSPSFSPMERASALRSTREAFIQEYHLPGRTLDRIMSEPFRCLDGLTPLEFEIQNWSPIWEGLTDEGIYSAGMETIRFLVEHWRSANDFNEPTVDGELSDPRSALVDLTRKACMRRLHHAPPESPVSYEDTTNTLYQRIVGFIWSQNAGDENGVAGMGQRLTRVGADDYKVSIVYEPTREEHNKGSSSSLIPTSYDGQSTQVTALISIGGFVSQLRNKNKQEEPYSPAIGRDYGAAIHSHQQRGGSIPRYHPYSRPTVPLQSNRNQQDEPHVSENTLHPSSFSGQSSATSQFALLLEFICARRAWTLGIGRNELELCIHEQEPNSKKDPDSVSELPCEDGEFLAMPAVFAELRLVPPPFNHQLIPEEIPVDYVFTFPEMGLSSQLVQDKDNSKSSMQAARINPCFSSAPPDVLHKERGSFISSFDDPRLLHDGELLLELRVRIRSALNTISSIDTISCTRGSISKGVVADASELTVSSWDAISVPSKSGTVSGVLSLDTTDVISSPLETPSIDTTDSSWDRIQ